MKRKQSFRGFTLVELMVVVAIVALLVALSLPAYQRYIRKANRAEAQQLMMQYANLQEIWRANDSDYAKSSDIAVPAHGRYTFYVRATGNTCENQDPTATQYTVVACALGGTDQVNDEERGASCSPLTLDQADIKTPINCW